MNDIREIKKMIERYYEGTSSGTDEQQLCEYFSSDGIDEELKPYRPIFTYLKKEKEKPAIEACALIPLKPYRRIRFRYAVTAAAAVACLVVAILLTGKLTPASDILCSETYVVINGICSDDLSLVGKHAAETIDRVTSPVDEGTITDILDFLD